MSRFGLGNNGFAEKNDGKVDEKREEKETTGCPGLGWETMGLPAGSQPLTPGSCDINCPLKPPTLSHYSFSPAGK